MRLTGVAFAALVATLAVAAGAQTPAPQVHGTPTTKPAASTGVYDGQIRRINKESRRVTISHGPLTGFDMPAMTMAFRVKDPAQLATLKDGDKVKFSLEKSGDDLVVTRIEAAK